MGLTFAAPLVLAAFVVLPALYYLLRVMPPPARRLFFPPADLFLKADAEHKTPVHTPWWILLLRLLLLASVILAMAGPVWQKLSASGTGPLLVVMDDSWAAAPSWELRLEAARHSINDAERAGRIVALSLASDAQREVVFGDAATALARLDAAKPQALSFDRAPQLEAIKKAKPAGGDILWLGDGLEAGQGRDFASQLAGFGTLQVFLDDKPTFGITDFDGTTVSILSSKQTPAKQSLRVLDTKSRVLAAYPLDFSSTLLQKITLDLPLELRNEIARLDLAGVASAGAVYLTDDSKRRVRVGVFADVSSDVSQQNLLNPAFYLKRALSPFAEIVEPKADAAQPVLDLIKHEPGVVVLADAAGFAPDVLDALSEFVDKGGLLVRFAGPHLAKQDDALLPAKLRGGGRSLGGALSWDQPKALAAFEEGSLFAGLTVPKDVSVNSQVLAEPDEALNAKVWARLSDGTPLVTADKRGKGSIVLFHVTADAAWSNLALSGLFVEMMQRVITLGPRLAGAKSASSKLAPPLFSLSGFGVLTSPAATAEPLERGVVAKAGLKHPPGLYGDAERVIALNTLDAKSDLKPIDVSGLELTLVGAAQSSLDFRPWLLILAFALFLIDTAILILPNRSRGVAAAAMMLGAVLVAPQPQSARAAEAATLSAKDIEASLNVHLAYFVTGDKDVDETSRLGLQNLSNALARRTSVTPGDPVALDPARDVLDLYPMIYWPVSLKAAQPSKDAVARIGAFMKQGGTLIIDTRDAQVQRPDGSSPEQVWLQSALKGLNVPPLEPLPRDHVITKTFYLLEGFYGRTMTGTTYVEALPPSEDELRPARAGDSVSPIVITSNDLAAGWAADDSGRALFPLTPGGPRQRELSLRGGVNLVMYTLTGNYKSDQVHVPALMDRLRH